MTNEGKRWIVGALCVVVIIIAFGSLWMGEDDFQLRDKDVRREVDSDPLAYLQRIPGRDWRSLPDPSRNVWLTLHFERLVTVDNWAPHTQTSGQSGPIREIPAPTSAEIMAAYSDMRISGMDNLVATYFSSTSPNPSAKTSLRKSLLDQASTIRDLRRIYISQHFDSIKTLYAPF